MGRERSATGCHTRSGLRARLQQFIKAVGRLAAALADAEEGLQRVRDILLLQRPRLRAMQALVARRQNAAQILLRDDSAVSASATCSIFSGPALRSMRASCCHSGSPPSPLPMGLRHDLTLSHTCRNWQDSRHDRGTESEITLNTYR